MSNLKPWQRAKVSFHHRVRRAWDGAAMFLLTMHPHITAQGCCLPLPEHLIRHMKAKDGCWFAMHAQGAKWRRG